jgi:CheY-like chemotaxis protein
MSARLLLADDSVTIQRVIELTFADEDVTVIAVGDGDAAIARLDSDPPDIVLADVGMPGRDGYAVAAHVKATPALAHIPVLLLAGAFEPVDEARVAETGCAGVLVKPFEPQMVIARVRRLLDERRKGAQETTAHDAAPVGQPESAATQAPADFDAASALLAAPPASPADRAATVDDYFDRLDAAFAHLQRDDPHAMPAAAAPLASAVSVPAEPPAAASGSTESPISLAAGPLSMADAFDALLGVEQGAPPPVLPDTWTPIVTDDLIDEVARRVADQVSERVARDLAPGIVTRVAERLVREELAKLRAEAETAS